MASAGIRKTPTGRYKVWWRLDDVSQGSQTFSTRDGARDFKHDLLARLARGTWVDPRLGKQTFETWAREWWLFSCFRGSRGRLHTCVSA
jgi:hypothetical protein